jgi:excisionase family DNA binding protein
MRPLLDADEVARFLNVPKRRVWQMSRRGEIPTVRIGPRQLRFDPDDLEAWRERRKSWTPKGTQ